jgi:hypothetical protein
MQNGMHRSIFQLQVLPRAQRKEIRVGVSNGTRTEVVEGLKQGETVILQ